MWEQQKHLPVNKKVQCDLSCEKMYESEQQSIVSQEGREAENRGTMGGIRLQHAIFGVKAVQVENLSLIKDTNCLNLLDIH